MPLNQKDIDALLTFAVVGEIGLASTVERLSKLVHILWKEVENLERFVQVIPEGLRIKAGPSEILVLKNGGVMIDGLRVRLKTLGKGEFYY